MTHEIPLTQGKIALIDDDDYEEISKYKWFANKRGKTYYAIRNSTYENGKRYLIYMHSIIAGTPKGMETDHMNGNGLDNRKENLRFCSPMENTYNRPEMKRKTPKFSKYKGVYWRKSRNKWHVRIQANGKREYVGMYDDEIEAAKAYDAAAKKFHGEFAYLNFPE